MYCICGNVLVHKKRSLLSSAQLIFPVLKISIELTVLYCTVYIVAYVLYIKVTFDMGH